MEWNEVTVQVIYLKCSALLSLSLLVAPHAKQLIEGKQFDPSSQFQTKCKRQERMANKEQGTATVQRQQK